MPKAALQVLRSPNDRDGDHSKLRHCQTRTYICTNRGGSYPSPNTPVQTPMFQNSAICGDIRYAVRLMLRTPLFTATVVLTVAIAIAANATIFTVVNAVMIRSLPFAQPDRIMQVAEKNDKLNLPNF